MPVGAEGHTPVRVIHIGLLRIVFAFDAGAIYQHLLSSWLSGPRGRCFVAATSPGSSIAPLKEPHTALHPRSRSRTVQWSDRWRIFPSQLGS